MIDKDHIKMILFTVWIPTDNNYSILNGLVYIPVVTTSITSFIKKSLDKSVYFEPGSAIRLLLSFIWCLHDALKLWLRVFGNFCKNILVLKGGGISSDWFSKEKIPTKATRTRAEIEWDENKYFMEQIMILAQTNGKLTIRNEL